MKPQNNPTKIDEEECLDQATAAQLGKIVEFLRNIEED